jgi:hypothetical protein
MILYSRRFFQEKTFATVRLPALIDRILFYPIIINDYTDGYATFTALVNITTCIYSAILS